MANDSTVRKVFYEKRSTEDGSESYIVAIDYEAGLVAYVHPASYDGDIFKDPGAAYARTADGLNAAVETPIASVDTVLAAPALVIERSASGVASVDVVLSSGFRVQLIAEYAPDMDVSTVKEIAESVK
jgi:hypothetical protein